MSSNSSSFRMPRRSSLSQTARGRSPSPSQSYSSPSKRSRIGPRPNTNSPFFSARRKRFHNCPLHRLRRTSQARHALLQREYFVNSSEKTFAKRDSQKQLVNRRGEVLCTQWQFRGCTEDHVGSFQASMLALRKTDHGAFRCSPSEEGLSLKHHLYLLPGRKPSIVSRYFTFYLLFQTYFIMALTPAFALFLILMPLVIRNPLKKIQKYFSHLCCMNLIRTVLRTLH